MRWRETKAGLRWASMLVLTVAVIAIAGGRAWAHDGESEGGDGSGDGGSDHTQSCRPACNQVRGSCKEAAGTSFASCTSQCKAAIFPEQCFRVCRQSAKSARSACRSDCHDCKMTCPPPGDGGGACDDACMADLATCASGLRSAAKECANGCTETAQTAFGECLAGDEPLSCLVKATGVLGHCLGECAGTLKEGNDACKEAADACRGSCQTGSASRAFLDPTETLLD